MLELLNLLRISASESIFLCWFYKVIYGHRVWILALFKVIYFPKNKQYTQLTVEDELDLKWVDFSNQLLGEIWYHESLYVFGCTRHFVGSGDGRQSYMKFYPSYMMLLDTDVEIQQESERIIM